ncbi:hypothetical protein MHB40_12655 [Lysinibacillus sp. FSL K6-0057]|jgi:hypothetical protein|uniref:hypothetical protein n=1 Tax=Lysinibacillus sp. FSL K6-0057 TaxID=2921411 RepID=UPI003159CECA
MLRNNRALSSIFCALLLCGRFTVQAAEEASTQTITLEDGTTANILVYLYDNQHRLHLTMLVKYLSYTKLILYDPITEIGDFIYSIIWPVCGIKKILL